MIFSQTIIMKKAYSIFGEYSTESLRYMFYGVVCNSRVQKSDLQEVKMEKTWFHPSIPIY